jgi:glycosyltransferase involved in cell wall biosynthesis
MTQITNDISVIICTYDGDRCNDLIAAVESVQQQTLPPREIIVVVDHNPSLLKRVQEQIQGVVVVENTQARGAGGARNSGIAVAKGKIIACLDDDAIALPDWLMLLSEGFTDPRVLGVGGSITPWWTGKRPTWFPEEFGWVVGCTFRGMPQTVATVRHLIGANMSLRREVFDTVGGLRTEIGRIGTWPMSGEENELCIRAQQFWPQSVFLYRPQAGVFHRVPDKRACWRYFCSRCYAEGLSKAVIGRYVGVKSGLATHGTTPLTYAFRTLPRGVVRGLADALLHHDLTGLARAGAIVAGLVITTVGYIVGSAFFQLERYRNMITRETVLHCNSKLPRSS